MLEPFIILKLISEINAILTSTKQTSRLVSRQFRIKKDVKCVFTLKYHDFFILSAGSSFAPLESFSTLRHDGYEKGAGLHV